jgi:hypothetical protein
MRVRKFCKRKPYDFSLLIASLLLLLDLCVTYPRYLQWVAVLD